MADDDLNSVNLARKIRAAFSDFMDMGISELTSQLSKRAPVDESNLRKSFIAQRRGEFDRLAGSTVGYAFAVSEGTQPHTIRAKDAPYLHFKVDGQWVKTKEVQHPGFEGDGFIDDAIEATSQRFSQFAKRAMSRHGL